MDEDDIPGDTTFLTHALQGQPHETHGGNLGGGTTELIPVIARRIIEKLPPGIATLNHVQHLLTRMDEETVLRHLYVPEAKPGFVYDLHCADITTACEKMGKLSIEHPEVSFRLISKNVNSHSCYSALSMSLRYPGSNGFERGKKILKHEKYEIIYLAGERWVKEKS